MYEKDLALNDQQWLICHKTKQNQTNSEGNPTLKSVSDTFI